MTGNMTGSLNGKVFNDRYEIIDRVGLGGMAEVYRAHDKRLDRIVAVKVMLPQYASDETFAERFRREAASAAALSSPYIVSIYDWGQDGDTYYIVMEYVRGSDLKTGIKERGVINQRKVAEIGSQVAAALSVAHNHNIIHRDIKPQNIMIQPDGNAKVMDFGIARAAGAASTGLTQTNSVLGTAHYISPEQAQGKELTPASDIYSLGVVMYEAATGQLPFDGTDAVSVALKQVSEIPAPPRSVNPDISPALESIIMMAMAKDPNQRFASASEMRKSLNDYLAGRPVSATQQFSGAETGYIAPVVAPVPVGGTSVMSPVDGKKANAAKKGKVTSVENKAEKDKKARNKKIAIGVVSVVVIAIIIGIIWGVMRGGSGNQVPDVTNESIAEATLTLEASGFKVGQVTHTYSDTVEEGMVISQDPSAGLKRAAGTTVNLVVSQGAESVTVPDLTGKTAEEATAALKAVGLTAVAGTAEYSNTVEKGKVSSQNPATGKTVNKGTTVEYRLSLGKETISVPSVVNYSESQATSTLKESGFAVNIERGYSSYVDQGYVYKQDPSSGKYESGTTITIYVSRGPETASVPNVVGLTASSAMSQLQQQGFNVVIGEGSSSDTVYKQSPGGGASVEVGSTVYIYAQSSGNTNNSNTNNSNTNKNGN